jgi:hypothetical protein
MELCFLVVLWLTGPLVSRAFSIYLNSGKTNAIFTLTPILLTPILQYPSMGTL